MLQSLAKICSNLRIETDSITLTTVDHVVNGVASGKKWTGYKIDADGEEALAVPGVITPCLDRTSGGKENNDQRGNTTYFELSSTHLTFSFRTRF